MTRPIRLLLLIGILPFLFLASYPLPLLAQEPILDFQAETLSDHYGIQLSWSEVAGSDHTEIQRSSNGVSAWESWAAPAGNQLVDTLVACSHTYYYRARTVDAAGVTSPWSSVVSAVVAPCAPVAVSVYPVPGWYILDVTWIDIALGETSVRLERSFDGVSWSELAELPANARYYADRFSTVECSSSLFYRLRTERDGVFSPFTPTQSNAVSPCSPSVQGLQVVHGGERIRLHWRDNAPDETGFEVWRRSDANPTSQLIATLPAAAAVGASVAWEDETPNCQVWNYYQIRATRGTNSASPWEPRTPDQLMMYVPNCPESASKPVELSIHPPLMIFPPSN
jgi:titin